MSADSIIKCLTCGDELTKSQARQLRVDTLPGAVMCDKCIRQYGWKLPNKS